MNGGVEVAVEGAAREDAVGVAGAVELELIDVIFVDHVQAGLLEELVVFGAGEGQAIVHDLVAVGLGEGEALIVLLGVAAPGGEPDADAGVIFGGSIAGFGEAVGEAVVEAPEGVGVIPAVVKEEGIELNVAVKDKLLAEGIDAVNGAGFTEAVFIAEVEPGVVVEERLIGAGALGFDVGEEVAAKLAGLRGSDDGGVDVCSGRRGEGDRGRARRAPDRCLRYWRRAGARNRSRDWRRRWANL